MPSKTKKRNPSKLRVEPVRLSANDAEKLFTNLLNRRGDDAERAHVIGHFEQLCTSARADVLRAEKGPLDANIRAELKEPRHAVRYLRDVLTKHDLSPMARRYLCLNGAPGSFPPRALLSMLTDLQKALDAAVSTPDPIARFPKGFHGPAQALDIRARVAAGSTSQG